jgi:hypothetical protein
MRYEVHIGMSNAAFEDDDPGFEVARLLRELADEVEGRSLAGLQQPVRLRDYNGNRVGFGVAVEPMDEVVR